MKEIKLPKNKIALVSDKDFERLSKYKWHTISKHYVATTLGDRELLMHRLIMDTPEGMEIDHINHNGYDNRRENLRTVTHQQNLFNKGMSKNNTSGFKGVDWVGKRNKWRARIYKDGKDIGLGLYKNKEDAIKARILAEKEIFVYV